MEGTGGKSGRRSARHLQVEAFGLEMLRLRTGGLQVDSGVAQLLKVASAGPKPKRVVSGFRQATAVGKSDAAKIRARPKGLLGPEKQ